MLLIVVVLIIELAFGQYCPPHKFSMIEICNKKRKNVAFGKANIIFKNNHVLREYGRDFQILFNLFSE